MSQPVAFDILDDQAMVPVYPRIAARTFEPGTRVLVVAYEQRSQVSHDHFFAVVHDAWMNLPEHLASQWPSPDHLRRYCLVRAGFCDQRSIVCASRAEALRWVTEMRRHSPRPHARRQHSAGRHRADCRGSHDVGRASRGPGRRVPRAHATHGGDGALSRRREFSTAIRVAAVKRANGLCEAKGCAAVLVPGRWQLDHANPDGLTGEPTLSNGFPKSSKRDANPTPELPRRAMYVEAD